MVAAARRTILGRPPLDLSFASPDAAAEFADRHGGSSLAPAHVRLHGGASVTDLPGFFAASPPSPDAAVATSWWVQDIAASLPARLIPDQAADVLDACAAPGGKTMQLAAAGLRVTALDRSKSRLARLSANLERTGLAAELIAADALAWPGSRQFGSVLLDAPCSATGTFRRHPEVLHRVRASYIAEAAEAQLRLLTHARDWVKPGGTLVYSVCSLEPQEGERVITAFLEQDSSFTIQPPAAGELPDFVTSHERGWVRVLPGALEEQGGADGFFIARLVRGA
jgi:16S rRNA (cytosine967-C5)-methyltransferase